MGRATGRAVGRLMGRVGGRAVGRVLGRVTGMAVGADLAACSRVLGGGARTRINKRFRDAKPRKRSAFGRQNHVKQALSGGTTT